VSSALLLDVALKVSSRGPVEDAPRNFSVLCHPFSRMPSRTWIRFCPAGRMKRTHVLTPPPFYITRREVPGISDTGDSPFPSTDLEWNCPAVCLAPTRHAHVFFPEHDGENRPESPAASNFRRVSQLPVN